MIKRILFVVYGPTESNTIRANGVAKSRPKTVVHSHKRPLTGRIYTTGTMIFGRISGSTELAKSISDLPSVYTASRIRERRLRG